MAAYWAHFLYARRPDADSEESFAELLDLLRESAERHGLEVTANWLPAHRPAELRSAVGTYLEGRGLHWLAEMMKLARELRDQKRIDPALIEPVSSAVLNMVLEEGNLLENPKLPDDGTRITNEPSESEEIDRRGKLYAEYKVATKHPSNRSIYQAKNSGIHKPQFYAYLDGTLPVDSQTCVNFERFLREKKPPIPRRPRD